MSWPSITLSRRRMLHAHPPLPLHDLAMLKSHTISRALLVFSHFHVHALIIAFSLPFLFTTPYLLLKSLLSAKIQLHHISALGLLQMIPVEINLSFSPLSFHLMILQ